MGPDELVEACGRAATGLLGRLLGDDLVGAYLVGSGALGGVAPGQSDVDVVAVCATAPSRRPSTAMVAGLAELAMTWPLRGLELVLYPRAAVATPARRPRFALNLNVGPRMPYRVSFDPADEPAHWFLLDLAILRDHGRTLTGPPPRDLVGPIPRSWLLEAVRDSLAWHDAHEGAPQQTVLNASRGWRFASEGVWSSKDDAGAWALARTDDRATVEAALALRHGDRSRTLDPARVRAFQRRVREQVDGALAWLDEDPLVTERLLLAPLHPGDADELAAVLADPALHRFTGGRPATLQELRTRYAALAAGSGRPEELWRNWIVRRRADARPVGTVQATITRDHGGWTATIAWVIGVPWQRRGYAAEAARALVGWLARRDAREIVAHIHPDHAASAAVAARAGLRPTPDRVDGEQVWRLPGRR
jgi:RimJ/RimL family protein N-acetyltransferase